MRNSNFWLSFPFWLVLAIALLTGCSTDDPPAPAAEPAEVSSPSAPPTAAGSPNALSTNPTAGLDPSFAPISSRDRLASGEQIVAQGARFHLPQSWISEPPSSGMRLAQARIPGDAGEGQLTVFYFGPGGGGGLESNIQRWVGQVDVDPESQPLRDAFEVSGFKVTWIDVSGTLKPSTMGTGPTEPQPGSRLLAGVVEGGQGPWYFKATGPAETLLAEREAFLAMLRSITPHG